MVNRKMATRTPTITVDSHRRRCGSEIVDMASASLLQPVATLGCKARSASSNVFTEIPCIPPVSAPARSPMLSLGARKIVAPARKRAGATIFLAPKDNMGDLAGADTGGMQGISVKTFDDALRALQPSVATG